MKTIFILLVFVAVLSFVSLAFVLANGEHDFSETRRIINSRISCSSLTEDQLEEIGDFYMEQMHPGEMHEVMDRMMGGEGSESLRQMHINMARMMYCGESGRYGNMMSMTSSMGEPWMINMMRTGMMNNRDVGSGMMGMMSGDGMNYMMRYGQMNSMRNMMGYNSNKNGMMSGNMCGTM